MNVVSLAGTVTDRPFRPGNGGRTVVKLRVTATNANHADRIEFDAFGQPGDFAINLYVGDIISVLGRLENRTFREHDEEVQELRVVAQYIELISKSHDRKPKISGEPQPQLAGHEPH
jgi:hypothetical protein